MVWERFCGNPKNKYGTCNYAECPEYMSADGGDKFREYRWKCPYLKPLNNQKPIKENP